MNICVITSSFPTSRDDIAKAPFLLDFIEGLTKRGHQVYVFTQDCQGEKERVLKDVHVRWFPWKGSDRPLVHLNPFNPIDCLRITSLLVNGKKALVPFVKENRIDVCLALWVLPGGYFANYVFRRTQIPYSVWALGSDIYKYGKAPLLYPVMKRIMREAKSVFADGFDLVKKVEERFGKKCLFLATARRLKEFSGERTITPSGIYHFLFVGRLERVKGIDILLQSMALLTKENRASLHLTIVGGGSMEPWARAFVTRQGLTDKITLTGNVPDEQLSSIYASSDCVVIPSRSESIPLVFSESLAYNKELIVTDVGDMGMLGRQYEAAWVVPSENPVALKEAMEERVRSLDKGNEEKKRELMRLFNVDASVERFLSDFRNGESSQEY